ncbi:MAG: S9 family peptidase [Deltaproteobacteria bacterium HGW-Deltaproteobacteria-17]|nr:MAG: S9 family peptidase [Deltaproteobacteria bacterium HGW-Deltaproteobacteria-17]
MKISHSLFLILALLALAPAAMARTLTPEDLVAVKRVGSPAVTPDGKTVFYTVTGYDLKTNKGLTRIWSADVQGQTAPRAVTAADSSAFAPAVSPDGKTLAFVSVRKDGPQIWLLPLAAAAEASQLTELATGVSGPLVWSPDSRRILFNSAVDPKCMDVACIEASATAEKPRHSGQLFTGLLYRHWNAWRDGLVNHVLVVDVADGKLTLLTPGVHDSPPVALGGAVDYCFSPDGREVAFVMNTDALPAASTNNDVFVLDLAAGTSTRISTGRGNDFSPAFSPDGKYLAWLSMARPGYESDKADIILLDRAGKTRVNLTARLDRSVGQFAFAPDQNLIFFSAAEQGHEKMFRVNFSAQLYKDLDGVFVTDFVPLKNFRMILVNQTISTPPEIFFHGGKYASANPDALRDPALTPVSRVNDTLLAPIEMGRTEDLWFKGARGDQVHALILKPPAFSAAKKYPVVFLLHGGPQGSFGYDFHPRWNSQMFAAPGYVVVMPNFHGSNGYGQKFQDSIQGDWGGGPYQDVMAALKEVRKLPYVDPKRIGAAGASYGGYLINWIGGQNNEFLALVSHSGVFNIESMYGSTEELWFPERENLGAPWQNRKMYQKWSPHQFVGRWKTPTLVVHGAMDFRVTVDQGMQLFTSLQRLGVPSKFLYFPDEDHFVFKPQNRILWWNTVWQFLGSYLKP